MKVIKAYPPNWEFICATLGIDKNDIEKNSVVFTYGDTIYNPTGSKISFHLEAHEEVHSLQQGNYIGGPDAWWNEYLTNPEFRFNQEAAAYGRQMKVGSSNKDRRQIRYALKIFARALSSPVYGNCCTFEQARELIRKNIA